MSVFTNGITIKNTNSFSKFVFDAENSIALISANTTINSTIFRIIDVNNVVKFSLDPVTTAFTISTIPLTIDVSNNLTINTNQLQISTANSSFATFCTSYLSVLTTIGDPATSYIRTMTTNASASLVFKIGLNPLNNNSILSTSLNGSDALTMFTSQFAIKHPTTLNESIRIVNDQLTTSCSSYNFNTTLFNTAFNFNGGNGSKVSMSCALFEIYNTSLLPNYRASLDVDPVTGRRTGYDIVLNGDVLINGKLAVTRAITGNANVAAVAQNALEAYRQFARPLAGINPAL